MEGREAGTERREKQRKECAANRTKDIRMDQMISFITTLLPTLKEWGHHLPDSSPLGGLRIQALVTQMPNSECLIGKMYPQCLSW